MMTTARHFSPPPRPRFRDRAAGERSISSRTAIHWEPRLRLAFDGSLRLPILRSPKIAHEKDLHRLSRHRDQHLRLHPHRPSALPGDLPVPQGELRQERADVRRAARGLARPRRGQGLAGGREPLRLRPAGRQDGEEGLRGLPRRDHGRPQGRHAGRRRAALHARRHGGRRLRRLRKRPARPCPQGRRTGRAGRRRARPPLQHRRGHAARRHGAGAVQGISACRRARARRRSVHRDGGRHRGPHQAGDGGLRLPA